MIKKKVTNRVVVICFQISIFEPLETASILKKVELKRCDLLSN
ncbi:hypothetical protein M105_4722 [Bacteroides fragilis str. 1009-4-F |nr:hypothetical protein M106_3990 [Bacteroides fragilis str. 1009-4-F \